MNSLMQVVSNSQVKRYEVTSGLVAWYKLNETSGSTASDSSGNNNHLTLQNSPTWGNNCLTFNGSTQYDEILSPTNIPNINSNMTLSIWVKYSSASSRLIALSLNVSNSSASANSIDLELQGSNRMSAVSWGGGAVVNTTSPSTNQWHLVTFTRDTNSKIYIDGLLANTASNSTQSGTVGVIRLASFNSAFPTPYWIGSLDDARIYNRALSADEIYMLYANGPK